MCGCKRTHVCGYHAEIIRDLAERLAEAEAAGDGSALNIEVELAFYGDKVDLVLGDSR